ncbi:MAG: CPBP family intramembrane glutamic endopeptidase [Roseobacter sp.]
MIRDLLNLQAYRSHEMLVSAARGTEQIWRLVMGIILIAGVVLLLSQFVNQTLVTLLGNAGYASLVGADGGSTPISVLYLLTSFGFLTLGVVVALRVAHQRGFVALFGDGALFRQQFISVLAMMLLLNGCIVLLPPWNVGMPVEPNVAFGTWVVVLPFAIVAILIQVSAEEIVFRGYLQQQFAARFSSPLIWLGVPSALFGLGHYMPVAAGENAVFLAVWAGLFGLAMADITARAGTLGPAIALHLSHNAVAILFVSIQDELSGLALYTVEIDLADTEAVSGMFPVEFMMILISWLGARLAIRR